MNDEPNRSANESGFTADHGDAQNPGTQGTRALLGPLYDVKASETLHRAVAALASEGARAGSDRTAGRIFGLTRPPARTSGDGLALGRHSRARAPRRLLVASALAVVVVAALAIGLGARTSTSGPTVLQAARLGLAPATLPAPATSANDVAVLDRSAAGIDFPNWRPSLGWRATGARSDRLGGRTIATVFYEPTGAAVQARTRSEPGYGRVGYAIVEGRALPLPAGATRVSHGIAFHVLNANGATIVTWRRAGHTCILAARDVPSATLMKLAVWA
ncbi:MAG TPA: hypothetical protein VMG80_08455 [Solirubrobacteraceae bacterium]|nr:hypothetical protein [Solirubrobacteraceae bacterium]